MTPPLATHALRTFDRLCAQQITPGDARRIALDMRSALEAAGVQLPDDVPVDHLLLLAHVAACSIAVAPPPPLSERPTLRFTPPLPQRAGDTGALRCTRCQRGTRRVVDCSAAGLHAVCLRCFDNATESLRTQWIARCHTGWTDLPYALDATRASRPRRGRWSRIARAFAATVARRAA